MTTAIDSYRTAYLMSYRTPWQGTDGDLQAIMHRIGKRASEIETDCAVLDAMDDFASK